MKCYYDTGMTFTVGGEAATPTNTEGTGEALINLCNDTFLKETLLWKDDVWYMDGISLPILLWELE